MTFKALLKVINFWSGIRVYDIARMSGDDLSPDNGLCQVFNDSSEILYWDVENILDANVIEINAGQIENKTYIIVTVNTELTD